MDLPRKRSRRSSHERKMEKTWCNQTFRNSLVQSPAFQLGTSCVSALCGTIGHSPPRTTHVTHTHRGHILSTRFMSHSNPPFVKLQMPNMLQMSALTFVLPRSQLTPHSDGLNSTPFHIVLCCRWINMYCRAHVVYGCSFHDDPPSPYCKAWDPAPKR